MTKKRAKTEKAETAMDEAQTAMEVARYLQEHNFRNLAEALGIQQEAGEDAGNKDHD